jgi:hypothetical protein
MSEPKATMSGLCLRAVCERLPSGMLGKLAFVSKEFRNECKEEVLSRNRRITTKRARHEAHARPHYYALHTRCCLLTTEGEVQWAVDSGCPMDRLVQSLAFGGSVPALKKAIELGAHLSRVCTYAAKGGHLETLKWARLNGCRWSFDTCHQAALGGHLEVLKWAKEKGCPWDSQTCTHAAMGGHLEVIKWLRENGCQWDAWTSLEVAWGGHFEVLKWAIDNGVPHTDHRICILDCVRGTDYEDWYRAILSQLGY